MSESFTLWELIVELAHLIVAIAVLGYFIRNGIQYWKLRHGGVWIRISSAEVLEEGLKVYIDGDVVEVIGVARGKVKVRR